MKIQFTITAMLIIVAFAKKTYSQVNLNDTLRVCTELKSYDKMAGLKAEKWAPGQTLKVKFIGGNDFLQSKVKQYAVEWSKHCSIKFEFITSGVAQIRVSFENGKGSWSIIGKASESYSINPSTGQLYQSNNGPTMNFGWFNAYTPDEEFSRTVTHEFGHALGLIHEHQSPATRIPWNTDAVYRYYADTQGWSKPEVDQNIFNRYSSSSTQYSQYDKLSIMHYPIPASFLLDPSYEVGWNTHLSEIDKKFIPVIYPVPAAKKTNNSQRKNDDPPRAGDRAGTGGIRN